jgi:ABC-type Na+ efflux pump permease subunit
VSGSTGDSEGDASGVPEDVVTGFWLWVAALPLMVTNYGVDLATGPAQSWLVYAISGMFVFIVAAVVVTFLILMRHGYRWARTLLTGGGATTIVFVTVGLFAADRPEVAALVYAATGIVGSVLIAGGAYLLHRKDAHAFFTK